MGRSSWLGDANVSQGSLTTPAHSALGRHSRTLALVSLLTRRDRHPPAERERSSEVIRS
jgi:hypothetical protein